MWKILIGICFSLIMGVPEAQPTLSAPAENVYPQRNLAQIQLIQYEVTAVVEPLPIVVESPSPAHSHKPKAVVPRAPRVASANRWFSVPWASVKEFVGLCESGGSYTRKSNIYPRSTATGKYGFLKSTWAGHGGYPEAYLAPGEVQEQKALLLYTKGGLLPWKASMSCWSAKLRAAGIAF